MVNVEHVPAVTANVAEQGSATEHDIGAVYPLVVDEQPGSDAIMIRPCPLLGKLLKTAVPVKLLNPAPTANVWLLLPSVIVSTPPAPVLAIRTTTVELKVLVAVRHRPAVGVAVSEQIGATEHETGAAKVVLAFPQVVPEKIAVAVFVCPSDTKPFSM